MSVNEHLATAVEHVAGLRRATAGLKEALGTTVDVQRLRDDIARIADDIDLVARGAGVGDAGKVGAPGEIVFIPDDDYDPALWGDDVDDEGVGQHPRS
ncbi:hypothetical protein [Segeticoccus rhizosphaerae]|jgi:hypothetical protein|uniref:hypothetical protein n=1 Tax=Segeticoccus rhizosphaerae TaxID=1104777 RepID=UPI0010C11A39|nr:MULTISPECIES: hypothetical protein [Intrasporangiaceae]